MRHLVKITLSKARKIAENVARHHMNSGEPFVRKSKTGDFLVVIPIFSGKKIVSFAFGNIDENTGNYGGTSISSEHVEMMRRLRIAHGKRYVRKVK